MQCNICGANAFEAYRGRPAEVCAGCGAKARHRVALDVYRRMLFPLANRHAKLLHLAPEAFLHPALLDTFAAGYIAADAAPERYPHASALRLRLPDGFGIFPAGWFDAILHNHVLEHIPGHWGDHIAAFLRILKPGGLMIFSVPGPYLDRETEEGGEHLAGDNERLARFLQEDHLKIFGRDFVARLAIWPGAQLLGDGMSDARRAELAVRPGKAPFQILQKT